MIRRLLSVCVGVLLAVTAAACTAGGPRTSAARIGVAYDTASPGDESYIALVRKGLGQARAQFGSKIGAVREFFAQVDETEADKYARLVIMCESGYNPVIAAGYGYAGVDPATGPLARAAKQCPQTRFAVLDASTVSAPNIANLIFADEQGAFLVGAAAALTSRTGKVGFVGGCRIPLIGAFEAGYRAGAEAARPGTRVLASYLAETAATCTEGFTDRPGARTAAGRLYSDGADVVFHAAAGAGVGVFESAKTSGGLAIGVDSDQYQRFGPDLRPVIITSMLKHVDGAVSTFLREALTGRFVAGVHTFGLADGGVGYATSGPGSVDSSRTTLDSYRKQIIQGRIAVPSSP